jgi:hypothetical protein
MVRRRGFPCNSFEHAPEKPWSTFAPTITTARGIMQAHIVITVAFERAEQEHARCGQ